MTYTRILKGGASMGALMAALVAAAGSANAADAVETVTVTGYRAALESALNVKRTSTEMVDSINAELPGADIRAGSDRQRE